MTMIGTRALSTLALAAGMLGLTSVFAAGSAQAVSAGPSTVQLQPRTVQLGQSMVQLKTVQLDHVRTVQLGRHSMQASTVQLGPKHAMGPSTVQLLRPRTVQL